MCINYKETFYFSCLFWIEKFPCEQFPCTCLVLWRQKTSCAWQTWPNLPPTVSWSLVKLLRDRSRGEKATKTLTVPTCQSRQTVSLTVNRDSNSLNLFFLKIKSAKGLWIFTFSDITNIQSFIQVSQDLISLGCYELAEMKASHFFCHMARPESFRWAGSELYLQAEEEIFSEKKHTATGLKTKGFLKII